MGLALDKVTVPAPIHAQQHIAFNSFYLKIRLTYTTRDAFDCHFSVMVC